MDPWSCFSNFQITPLSGLLEAFVAFLLKPISLYRAARIVTIYNTPRYCPSFCTLKETGYSGIRNKHRGMLINFWTFFQGLRSLLERVMHVFFSKYLLFYGMGDAYFKGYA